MNSSVTTPSGLVGDRTKWPASTAYDPDLTFVDSAVVLRSSLLKKEERKATKKGN
jgi:hypothetical protein